MLETRYNYYIETKLQRGDEMFDRELEEMKAMKFFEKKDVAILDQFGIAKVSTGFTELTYEQAADMVERMKRAAPGVPKYLAPKFRSCMNSIRFAFGPEFCDRH